MKSNNFNETKLELAKNKFPYYLDMAKQLINLDEKDIFYLFKKILMKVKNF